MNDADGWIYFDGPEPERIRPLLDALRDLPPATPEDKERVARQFFDKLDATLSRREASADAGTAPEAPGERATEVVVSTALVPDLPAEVWERLGRLPFRPASPGQAVERTMPVPVLVRGQGETAPIRGDSIAKAVAALPFASNTVGAGIVLIPRLKLEEYASLRAELAVWPERVKEILPRYHMLNEAARRALDEHWAERLAGNGEERAAFERAVGEYSAWLRGRREGGGRREEAGSSRVASTSMLVAARGGIEARLKVLERRWLPFARVPHLRLLYTWTRLALSSRRDNVSRLSRITRVLCRAWRGAPTARRWPAGRKIRPSVSGTDSSRAGRRSP